MLYSELREAVIKSYNDIRGVSEINLNKKLDILNRFHEFTDNLEIGEPIEFREIINEYEPEMSPDDVYFGKNIYLIIYLFVMIQKSIKDTL